MGNDLSKKLEERKCETTAPAEGRAMSFADQFKAFMFKGNIMKQTKYLLPKNVAFDDFTRSLYVMIASDKDNKLAKCTPMSILIAAIKGAHFGLCANAMNHGWIVPFGNQAVFIPGYRGYEFVAYRSGIVDRVRYGDVWSEDEFSISEDGKVLHFPRSREGKCKFPFEEEDRGEFLGVYASYEFKDGTIETKTIGTKALERTRKRSRASANGPWVTDTIAMQIKTGIRALHRDCESKLAALGTYDETTARYIKEAEQVDDAEQEVPNLAEGFENFSDAEIVDAETGEIKEEKKGPPPAEQKQEPAQEKKQYPGFDQNEGA